MTQILTTEAMQEIYEAAVHSEASGSQEAEFELLCKLEDVGGTGATIRKLIDMVRAANRDAQPVGFDTTVSGRKGVIWHNGAPEDDTAIYTAPPAPSVPDNLAAAVNRLLDYDGTRGHFSAIRCSDAREEVERLLAQPVSSGYTLPPHSYRELVNSLRDTAVKYSGTDQLRERLNTALSQFIEPDHPHTRTAAPGGN